jgi:thiamine-phosphate pyrophosphorylase
MIAGEAGADYVAFSGREDRPELAADPSILSWWQVMMTLPCVAMGRIDLGEVADLARAGADFVVLDEAVWAHPEGAAAAVAEADRQLARVERES